MHPTTIGLRTIIVLLLLVVAMAHSQPLGITRAGYEAVTMGMSYAEVCRILGPPSRIVIETESAPPLPSSGVYVWAIKNAQGWDRVYIGISLQGDKVYKKTQNGL